MFEAGRRLGVVIALAVLAAGCARAVTTNVPASTSSEVRPPAAESPTNFASPTDMLQRYPTMRRQQL
ncbi:MAG TPA: hypothetical protein VK548_27910 [Candidatus Acidoferrum sp.]|nr:hypothetical protein [Candidatus Acidoferrum sp.]